jgi:hypothetical protein
MATPLGVYLTTGTVSGGAGTRGLVLAGMVMSAMMWLTQTVLAYGIGHLAQAVHNKIPHDLLTGLWALLAQQEISGTPAVLLFLFLVSTVLLFTVFLLLLRVLPFLAGYHAAEHQTVNAIEAGEPLTPESVASMPRVHPRCGTNLWGIMSLSYCGVMAMAMLLSTRFGRQHLFELVPLASFAIIFVAANWKRVGGWIQQHLTTRRASAKELASGIAAGKELLRQHLETPFMPPRRGLRLWRMGFIQVLIGVTMMGYLLQLLDVVWKNLVK